MNYYCDEYESAYLLNLLKEDFLGRRYPMNRKWSFFFIAQCIATGWYTPTEIQFILPCIIEEWEKTSFPNCQFIKIIMLEKQKYNNSSIHESLSRELAFSFTCSCRLFSVYLKSGTVLSITWEIKVHVRCVESLVIKADDWIWLSLSTVKGCLKINIWCWRTWKMKLVMALL